MKEIFDFSKIEPILNDTEAVKIFNNLLDAVISDDFSKMGALSSEVLYDYVFIRNKVETLIYDKFYEPVYENEAYIGLMNFIIDIYSIFLTMVNLRKNLVNIRLQTDEIVDAYLDMFGFPSKHLFDYIRRRDIAEKIYGYLRKKGTPESFTMILKFLGYDNYYVSEYWLTDKDDLRFKPEIIYNTSKEETIGESVFRTVTMEKNKDPLWIQTKEDVTKLLNNNRASLPIRSPYYGVGSILNDARTFRIFCAFNSVLIRKLSIAELNGNNIQTISPRHFTTNKVSYIDLLLGWAYVMDRLFNSSWIISTIHDVLNNRVSWAYSWNLDYSKPLKDVYEDIVKKVDTLFKPINTDDTVVDSSSFIESISPLQLKNERLEEIKNTFYNISEFDSVIQIRTDFINYFSSRNLKYFTFLKEKMDEYPLDEYGSLDHISSLLEEIADEIEYYLYDKADSKISIKQLTLTYYNFFKIMNEVDKSFTPYHATFLELNMLFLVQDFPGDQIVFDDYKVHPSGKIIILDRLNHMFDDNPNETYYDDTIFSQDIDKRENIKTDTGFINMIDPIAYNILWIYDVNDPFSHYRNLHEYEAPCNHENNNFFDEANHTRFDFVDVIHETNPLLS